MLKFTIAVGVLIWAYFVFLLQEAFGITWETAKSKDLALALTELQLCDALHELFRVFFDVLKSFLFRFDFA